MKTHKIKRVKVVFNVSESIKVQKKGFKKGYIFMIPGKEQKLNKHVKFPAMIIFYTGKLMGWKQINLMDVDNLVFNYEKSF